VEERRSEGEGEGWTVKLFGRFFSHVGRIAWNP
jgi:predicted Zn-dependent protease